MWWDRGNPGNTWAAARSLLSDFGEGLTYPQLHPLLYLVEGFRLAFRGTALIRDTILVGESGPEWPALKDERAPEHIDSEDYDSARSDSELKVIRHVHQHYGRLSADRLNALTSRQWPVAEHGVGEIINLSEMKVHFQDVVAAQRILQGGRMPDGIALRYREGTRVAVSGDEADKTGESPTRNEFVLPEVTLESRDYFGVDDACERLERQVRLSLRLWHKGSENFYVIAGQIERQIKWLRRAAEKVEREDDRRHLVRRLNRSRSTLSFLRDYGPRVEGSGVLRVAKSSSPKINSLTSGGLPGLGRRSGR